jgi:hypothetical protein
MVLAGPLYLKDKSPHPELSPWPIGAIHGVNGFGVFAAPRAAFAGQAGAPVLRRQTKSLPSVSPHLTLRLCQLTLELLQGGTMAKLALVYGMRLFPAEDLGEINEAVITLKDGRTSRVTMHLIEGSKEQIENMLQQSIEAFFEMYPEI